MTSRSTRRGRNNPTFLGGKGANEGLPQEELEPEPPPPENGGIPPEKGSTPQEKPAAGNWIEYLDPKIIRVPDGYFESHYDAEKMSDLRASMSSSVGQDSAATVKLDADGIYWLSGGKHRCEACEADGKEVRCEVSRGSLEDALDANAANAGNQSQPSDFEYMAKIGYRQEHMGHGIDRLSESMNKRPEWIQERLKVYYDAEDSVKEALQEGLIRWGHAAALAEIEDHGVQRELLSMAISGMGVAELKAYIQNDLNTPEEEPEDEAQHDVSFTARDTPSQTRKAPKCAGCGDDGESSNTESMPVCTQCLKALQTIGANRDLREGTVPVPVVTVREAVTWLAGSSGGAKVAELLEKILERAERGEGTENDG